MAKGLPAFYIYRYPRYFVFDESLLPDDFTLNDDYQWDEETGRLIEEDGSDYYRGFFIGQGRFSETQDARKIEWLNETEPLGVGEYKLFPLHLHNERQELEAAVNHLKIIDKVEDSDSQSTLTVEIVLDYQLDEQSNPKEFLAIVKRCISEFAYDSIVELRLKKKLVSWHNEKVNELENLLSFPTEPTQPPAAATAEPPEVTALDITKVAHKVVLFHELGVIEPLKRFCQSKNPTLSDTQFADLVGSMMGFQGKQLETVRKALSGYGQGGSGDVKSAAAINKVKSELMKFGIEL